VNENDLSILIKTKIDTSTQAITDLNKQIAELSKKVSALDLKIGIDTETLNKSINSFDKIKSVIDNANQVVEENQHIYKKLDGTVVTITEKTNKMGEVVKNVRVVHDENKRSVQQETKALDDQRKTLEMLLIEYSQFSKNVRTKLNYNQFGEVIGAIHTLQDEINNNKLVVKTDKQGFITNYSQIEEYLKNYKSALEEEKLYYLAHQENIKKNLDFEQSIASRRAKIDDLMRRFGADQNVAQQLKEVNKQLSGITFSGNNGLTGISGSYKTALKDIDIQLKNITASAKTAGSNVLSFGEALRIALTRITQWGIATTAVYGSLHALEGGIKYVYDLDTALTDLTKTSDLTKENFASFAKQATQTANSVGALTLDVIKSTTEWTRLGYSLQQAQQLAKETVIYQNVGDISSAEEASTDLIAAIKGFGIEVDNQGKNIQHLVDVYNEVGNKFAISSAGIGEAAKRSASALTEAGNSMEQSIALITAANASIQDPERVGNALKTLSLRLRGISEDGEEVANLVPTLEEKFNSIGLSLKNDNNSFKSTYEIFQELAGVWNKLSDFQKSDILELIAGKEQANVAASLIENWKDAEGALQAGLDSFGSAARENAKYLDSLQGHIAKFRNAINDFWSSNITSDALKDIVDIGTSAINVLKSLTDTFGGLNIVVFATTASFLKFTSVGNSLSKSLTMIVPGALKLNTTIDSLKDRINVISTALTRFPRTAQAAGVSLGALRLALIGTQVAAAALEATLTLGLSLAITGVVAGLSALYTQHQKNIQQEKEFQQQQKQIADNYANQKDHINDLLNTYNELDKATNGGKVFSDIDQETKYKDTVQQLADLMPNLVQSIDDKGQAHLKNADAIKQELEYAQQLADQEAKQNILDAKDNFKDQLEQLKKDQKEVADIQAKIAMGGYIVADGGFGTFIKYTDSELNELQTKLIQAQYKVATSTNNIRDSLNGLTQTILEQNHVKLDDNLSKELEDISRNLDVNLSSDQLYDKANALAAFFDKLNSLKNIKDQNQFKILSEDLVKYGNSIGIADSKTKSFIDGLKKGSSQTTQSLQEFLNTLDDTSPLLDDLSKEASSAESELKALNQALYDSSKGKSLDAKSIGELISSYPELIQYIRQTKDGWTLEKSALDALRVSQADLLAQTKAAEAAKTSEVYKQLQNRLKYYGLEIDSITDLATAQQAIANIYNNPISQTGEEITMGNVHVKALNQDAQNTINLIHELVDLQDNYKKKFQDIFSNPNYGVSSSKSSSTNQYEPNLNISKAQLEVDKYNRLLDDNSKKIDEAKAKNESYDKLLSDRLTLYSKLTVALNNLNKEQLSEKSSLQSKLTRVGLVQNGEVVDNVEDKLVALSKSKASARLGYTASQLESMVERFLELDNKLGDTKSQLEQATTDIADTLQMGLDKIQSVAERSKSLANNKISLLGEINTKEEKAALANDSNEILSALVTEKNKILSEIAKAKTIINSNATSAIKEANKIYLQSLMSALDSVSADLISQAETVGKQQAEALAEGFNETLSDLDFQKTLLGNIDTDEEKKQAQQINSQIRDTLLAGIKSYNSQIVELERKLTTTLTEEERHRAQAKLEELKSYVRDYQTQMVQLDDQIESDLESQVDDYIDAYKKMLEQQKDLALKAIDAQIDAENERHDQKMKNLDDEYNKFEEYINAQMEALDRANSTEDYQQDLQKLLDERAKIQAQYNTLLKDDSFEAKARRADLQQQLSDIDEQIAEKQRDRERELTKNALQDQLDDRKDYIDEQKELEDNYHDSVSKQLEDEKQEREDYYDSILEDERYFYQLKQDLMSQDATKVESTLNLIRGQYDEFFADLKNNASLLGDMFSTINSNFQMDYEKLNDFPIPTGNSSNSSGSSNSSISNGSIGSVVTSTAQNAIRENAWKEYLSNKQKYDSLAKEIQSGGLSQSQIATIRNQMEQLRSINQEYRDKFSFPDGSYDQLKNLQVYHQGGEVGVEGTTTQKWLDRILKSNEIPAILKKGEVVLDNPVSFINSLVNRVAVGMSAITPKQASASSTVTTNIENITMNFPSTPKNGSSFANDFISSLNKKGVRIGRG